MSSRRWLMAVAITGLAAVVAAAAANRNGFGVNADTAFTSDTEKVSYAIGVNLARQLKTMARDVDERSLTKGFIDGRSPDAKMRLTNEEITAALASLRKTYKESVQAAQATAGKPVTANTGISVFFKMDPRLTASYGGDRWVSPATYTRVGDANGAVIETRAQARPATPAATPLPLTWTSSDPGMVHVTPERGGNVRITVTRPGSSVIRVASGELMKELIVTAESRDNALQVAISQK